MKKLKGRQAGGQTRRVCLLYPQKHCRCK